VADGSEIRNTAGVTSEVDVEAGNDTVTVTTRTSNPPPEIVCPRDMTATASSGEGVSVSYKAPLVRDNTGGATVAYAPESGSTFPVGTTDVTATVNDAGGATATCTFRVRVLVNKAPPVNFYR
jgi:large repetitive protein